MIVSMSSPSFYCDSEFIRLCRLCFSLSDSFCLSFAREQSYMESVVTFLQDVVPQVSMSEHRSGQEALESCSST